MFTVPLTSNYSIKKNFNINLKPGKFNSSSLFLMYEVKFCYFYGITSAFAVRKAYLFHKLHCLSINNIT